MTPEEQSPEVRELLLSIRRGHAYTFHVLALFAIPLAAAAGFLVLPQPFGALSVGLPSSSRARRDSTRGGWRLG